jgi:hypothetical protein
MKKTTFILLFMALAFGAVAARPRVIVSPSYEVKKYGVHNVDKIELGETETWVHVRSTFSPHWWLQFSKNDFIRDTKTGKTYQAIGIVGAEFDNFNHLRGLFKFNAIPRYVVIDKNGKVVDGDFPMYRFETELNRIMVVK